MVADRNNNWMYSLVLLLMSISLIASGNLSSDKLPEKDDARVQLLQDQLSDITQAEFIILKDGRIMACSTTPPEEDTSKIRMVALPLGRILSYDKEDLAEKADKIIKFDSLEWEDYARRFLRGENSVAAIISSSN